MSYKAVRLWLDRAQPFGLLFLRLGIGLMFVLVHGWPKISGGVQTWERLGLNVGLTVVPAFWGFLTAASEFIGGLCLITGFLFRPACALLAATMAGAVVYNFRLGQGLASHPFEIGLLFVSLFWIGPGPWTLAALLKRKQASSGAAREILRQR